MPAAIIVLLTCTALPREAPAARTAALSNAVPAEHVETDSYNLTATYDRHQADGVIGLVLDQQDGRNAYLLDITPRRTQLLKLVDGDPKPLVNGPGSRTAGEGPLQVTVCRRPGTIRVFLGSALVALAHDTAFAGGACGVPDIANTPAPSDLLLQEIGPIHFEDDFFAGDERQDLWEPLIGQFRIGVYWDPKQKLDSRPIGASWYANQGAGTHLAVTADDFWDDYACEVTACPAPDSLVGLAFRVHNVQNYGLLSLSTGGSDQESTIRLVEVVSGEEHVLSEKRGRWSSGEWHRLRVDVAGSEALGSVDGDPVGPCELGGYRWGRVGLYTKTEGDCRFDDLAVSGIRRLEPPARPQPHGPWTFPAGVWRLSKKGLRCHATSTGVAVASLGAFGDCDVSSTVRLEKGAEAGLLARWSDPGGYGLVVRSDGPELVATAVKVGDDGTSAVLSEGRCEADSDGPVELRMTADGIGLRGFVDGRCVVKAWDGQFAQGDVGLIVVEGQANFEGFRASAPALGETVTVLLADGSGLTRPGAQHGLFERFLGDLWKPLAGEWSLTTVSDEPCLQLRGGVMRFYAPRPGDVSLAADVLRTDGSAVSLGICADGQAADTGYRLSLTSDRLVLHRNAQEAASAPLSGPQELPVKLALRRDGPYVAGAAGHNVVVLRDEQPLESGYATIGAEGEALLDSIELGADHTLAYRFDRAEPDWVASSGEWLFHSGMACIPWAYWLTGDGRAQPAFTWNRHLGPADLAASFDVSEYTTGYESGEHQHYPYHDISLVVAAEERHPDSGYRFVIGAEGGRYTRLYRNGEMVKQVGDPRFAITMGGHCNAPRAVEVHALKHGGHLELILNGTQALNYDDPTPLGVGLVGIGAAGCRANFRDLFLYCDRTWEHPAGVTHFSPR